MAKDPTPANPPPGNPPGVDAGVALKAKVKELEESVEKLLDENAKSKQEADILTKALNRVVGDAPAKEKAKKPWWRKLITG